MSVLPRAVPARFTEQLQAALMAAGVDFDPTLKPGTRLTYVVTHLGRTWEVQYVLQHSGTPLWKLTGPGANYEWGPSADTADVVAAVTAPDPEPAAAPVDPHPKVPRTHLGFEVPEFIRAAWADDLGQGWRLGVASAVGKLPDTRPRC
ncbi:hypothetical protein [Streptomyces sp. NPDC046976]|uniref:hypothetical protein n=1 Tax=Streptomyces sp. NPDC046976 TaxID=3155258 RepID=UPI0033CF9DC1